MAHGPERQTAMQLQHSTQKTAFAQKLLLECPEPACTRLHELTLSRPEKGVITKGVFWLEESLESLNRFFLFPHSEDSLDF